VVHEGEGGAQIVGRISTLFCLLALVAVVGCGGGTSSTTTPPSSTTNASDAHKSSASHPAREVEAAEAKRPQVTEIWRADATGVGMILFNSSGYTLYRFEGDKGTTPTCYGACARKWPPVLTKGRVFGRSIYHNKVGTTKRAGGAIQVTYAGHPLYTFSGDKTTGETSGNGVVAFGGGWHALHPSGENAGE
jgi:predicted lipoprotein with Yx(FWY)xxD motif